MIGIDSAFLRVSVTIFAVAEKSGRVVRRRVEELDRDFVVDRLVGRSPPPAPAALTELFEISITRPMNVVSGNASIWMTAESPSAMRATSVSSTFTLVSSTLMSLIVSSVAASLFSVPMIAVSPSRRRRVTCPLIGAKIVVLLERAAARRAATRAGLVDLMLRGLVERLVHLDLRLELLELLVGDELRVDAS